MASDDPPGDDDEARRRQNIGRTAYEVGYGKPPEASRFKPGNRAAAGRRSKTWRPHDQLVADLLDENVRVVKGGRRVRMTHREALVRSDISRAAAGDHRAAERLNRSILRHRPVAPENTSTAQEAAELRRRIETVAKRLREDDNDRRD